LGREPDSESLRRIRPTRQQARLSGAARQTNVSQAFQWVNTTAAPASVLLVDDVFTTGATMQECARILKRAGAKTVWGWAIARG
jgi:predicted amidophosphoribosyltransferase